MTDYPTRPRPTTPPSKHQLALMIWLCVFPTLTVLNLALADSLRTLSPVPRTFVLATIAVPNRDLRADAVSAPAARAAPDTQPRGLASPGLDMPAPAFLL